MARPRTIVAGSGLALAAIIMGEGDQTANDAFAAIVIAFAATVALTVAGLVAALVIRSRRARLTYRPTPAMTRVRANVIGTHPAASELRHLGDAPERLALPPAASDRANVG